MKHLNIISMVVLFLIYCLLIQYTGEFGKLVTLAAGGWQIGTWITKLADRITEKYGR